MKKFSSDKDINKEIKILIKQGWVYLKGKKHGKIVSPNGSKMSIPGTPSDRRAFYNFKSESQKMKNMDINYVL